VETSRGKFFKVKTEKYIKFMRYIITHGHIFKNAGTTFDSALKRAFGKDFCDHRDDKAMRLGGAEYLKQYILDNPNLKAISSHHLCNPLPESEDFLCIPVFFLRNPIDRIVSVYEFERKQKRGSRGAEMASKLSFIDYVKWRMEPKVPKVIFDYQTAYLGKDSMSKNTDHQDIEVFKNAISKIESQNVLVGTVGRFEESFQYIQENLQKFFPEITFEYQIKNINQKARPEEKLNNALQKLMPILPEVLSRNSYDIALYNIANENLTQRLRNGPAL
jgi:hypothetical protein